MGSNNYDYYNAIALDERLNAPHKSVLYALVSFRNNASGRCNPSIDSIAKRAGMSRRHAITTLGELREFEVVAFRSVRNVPNQYELYPTPERFLPNGHADHKVNDPLVDAINYTPEPEHFGLEHTTRAEFDIPEWNDAISRNLFDSIDTICRRINGITLGQLMRSPSQSGDMETLPF